MSWLRLDASAFHDRAIRRTGSHGRRAFIAALMLSRERDWRKGDAPGWLPASEFDPLEIAQHWGERETEANLKAYEQAIEGLAAPGGPFEWDGDGWWLAGWRKYQPDPTALARKRKERVAKWRELKADGHSDKAEADSGSTQKDVTAGHSDKRDGHAVTPTIRDVTTRRRGRDGTERPRPRLREEGRKEPDGSASASVGGPTSADPPEDGRDGAPAPHGEAEHVKAILAQLAAGSPRASAEGTR